MTHREKLIVVRLLKAILNEDRAIREFNDATGSRTLSRKRAEATLNEVEAAYKAVAALVSGYDVS